MCYMRSEVMPLLNISSLTNYITLGCQLLSQCSVLTHDQDHELEQVE